MVSMENKNITPEERAVFDALQSFVEQNGDEAIDAMGSTEQLVDAITYMDPELESMDEDVLHEAIEAWLSEWLSTYE
jgi:hypothetical protein